MDGHEDSLRGVTPACKPFNVFGLSRWNSRLELPRAVGQCFRHSEKWCSGGHGSVASACSS